MNVKTKERLIDKVLERRKKQLLYPKLEENR